MSCMGSSRCKRDHSVSSLRGLVVALAAGASLLMFASLGAADAFVGPAIGTSSRMLVKSKPDTSRLRMAARVKEYDPNNPPCEVLEVFYSDILFGKKSDERKRVLLGNLPKLEECFLKDQQKEETIVLLLANVKHRLTGEIEHFKLLSGYD